METEVKKVWSDVSQQPSLVPLEPCKDLIAANKELFRMLVAAGADLNAENDNGETVTLVIK